MARRSPILILILAFAFTVTARAAVSYSSRLIHRFSDKARALTVSRNGSVSWPEKRSLEYYQMLVSRDFKRQKMKLGPKYQFVFPSQGSKTMSPGNDFGWLHYTWIDIGMPSVSFLVALDTGSDLLWVPCDCQQCAPLSAKYYSILDRDLNEYRPSSSSTSKQLSCSHQLCENNPNCKSPKQQCPYAMSYNTEDTSSSGFLVEDLLHLKSANGSTSKASVQAPVIIGCGMKQSGSYLEGVAPDGLMGLGLGDAAVPSFLARAGLIHNSFSMCFDEDDSGRIFFGDQGPATQQSTPFVPLNGKYETYIVGVKACCVGNSCLEQTSFKASVDTGTSFTFLPEEAYTKVTDEFDKQFNGTVTSFEGYPWKYCYKSSADELSKVPKIKLIFPLNNSFVVHNPVFMVSGIEGPLGFCLAVAPIDGDTGTIGQNFMSGYRLVFDKENMKLGWSQSSCQDIADGKNMPVAPPNGTSTSNSLPTNDHKNNASGDAVPPPALAGRAPSKPSVAPTRSITSHNWLLKLLPLLIPLSFWLIDTGTC